MKRMKQHETVSPVSSGADETDETHETVSPVSPSGFWVRLWQDMPTDPKWRLIAKKSGQPISAVIAVFNVLMLQAGERTMAQADARDRGTVKGGDDDVIGATLDLEGDAVAAIRAAMQGLVLEGDALRGWANRQPQRSDLSTDRVRACRERKRAAAGKVKRVKQSETVTQRYETPDTDTETETEEKKVERAREKNSPADAAPAGPINPDTIRAMRAQGIEPDYSEAEARWSPANDGHPPPSAPLQPDPAKVDAMLAKALEKPPAPPARKVSRGAVAVGKAAAKALAKVAEEAELFDTGGGKPMAPHEPVGHIPDDWHPEPLEPGTNGAAIVAGWDKARLGREIEKFHAHFQALGGPGSKRRDWQASWRTWVLKSPEFEPHRPAERGNAWVEMAAKGRAMQATQ